MDLNMQINVQIPKSIDNALCNLLDGPTKFVGTLIKDALYLKFGFISEKAERKRLLEHYGLSDAIERLQANIHEIPLEKLVKPDYQTLMLELDGLEPCINSEELRNLFANLIARSCNSDYKDIIHPSIPVILSQMSPFDAKILKFFIDTEPKRIITYTHFNENKRDAFNRIPYMFDSYPDPKDAKYVSISISSLMHLGLLAFDDDAIVFPVNDSPFIKTDFYEQCEKKRIELGKYASSRITGKMCILTPLGIVLIRSCLD